MNDVKITDFIVDELYSYSDPSGEYKTAYSCYFMLSKVETFSVLGIEYKIDRVLMSPKHCFYDEIAIRLANEEKDFDCIKVPDELMLQIIKRLEREEKTGKLKGYLFSDDLREQMEEGA